MNKKSIYMIVPFISIILFFNIGSLLEPDKEKSDVENRTLAKSATVSDLWSGSFPKKYEDYFDDHLILRDKFTHLSVKKDLLLNKTNVNGKYIVNDEILEEPLIKVEKNTINDTANKIVKFNNEVKKLNKDFIYIMNPRKSTVKQYLLPEYLQKQNEDINQSYYLLDNIAGKGVETINVLKYFEENFDSDDFDNFYFRTDHHWNSIGAYEGLKYCINELNKDDYGMNFLMKDEDYVTSNLDDIKFLGSLNKQLFEEIKYETQIPYIHRKDQSDNSKKYWMLQQNKVTPVDERKVVARDINKTNDFITYSEAYTADLAYYKVVNNNYKIDKKLIVFKDSYQNAMSWMISDLFKQVEFVDLRHTGKKTAMDFIKESDADMVWIMYNNRNLAGDIFKLY